MRSGTLLTFFQANRLIAASGIAVGMATFLLSSNFASAQSVDEFSINGNPAQIIQVATQKPIGQEFKRYSIRKRILSNRIRGLQVDARYLKHIKKLYASKGYAPIWLNKNGLTRKATLLTTELSKAALVGLPVEDYGLVGLTSRLFAQDRSLTDIEISYALIRYVDHLTNGRVLPSAIVKERDFKFKRQSPVRIVRKLLRSENPIETLIGFEPKHSGYQRLKSRLADLHKQTAVTQQITSRILLRGSTGEDVAKLRKSLGLIKGSNPKVFDDALEAAIVQSQASLGLPTDGIADRRFIKAWLNRHSQNELEQIAHNMDRWRWLRGKQFDKRHIWINLPEFKVKLVHNDQVHYETTGIIGRRDAPTPLISSRIKNIILNPYWYLPPSVIKQEILESHGNNPVPYLKQKRISLFRKNGNRIRPETIKWSKKSSPYKYVFRQSPGPENALGRVKILFPNAHAIYLHDTNERELFANKDLALSYGCIRLEDPIEFSNAIAGFDPHLASQMPGDLVGQGSESDREIWLSYRAELPLHLVYFTYEVAPDGSVKQHPDVYRYDSAAQAILKKRGLKPSNPTDLEVANRSKI